MAMPEGLFNALLSGQRNLSREEYQSQLTAVLGSENQFRSRYLNSPMQGLSASQLMRREEMEAHNLWYEAIDGHLIVTIEGSKAVIHDKKELKAFVDSVIDSNWNCLDKRMKDSVRKK